MDLVGPRMAAMRVERRHFYRAESGLKPILLLFTTILHPVLQLKAYHTSHLQGLGRARSTWIKLLKLSDLSLPSG
jgi:hypothetical protein